METKESAEVYFSVFAGTLIILLFAIAIIIFFIVFKKKLVEQQLRIEKKESDHRLSLLQNSIEITEKERKRIAGDLHDEIGTHLSSVRMTLNAIRSKSNSDAELLKFADDGKEILDDTIENVRRIAHNLLPPGLETFGFSDTATDLCSKLSNSSGIPISIKTNNLKIKNPESELALYRILQELLTNSMKHASPKNIHIELEEKPYFLHFKYEDDGNGFTIDEAVNKKGLGLRNIESRVAALKGKVEFTSSPGKGLSLQITLPFNHEK